MKFEVSDECLLKTSGTALLGFGSWAFLAPQNNNNFLSNKVWAVNERRRCLVRFWRDGRSRGCVGALQGAMPVQTAHHRLSPTPASHSPRLLQSAGYNEGYTRVAGELASLAGASLRASEPASAGMAPPASSSSSSARSCRRQSVGHRSWRQQEDQEARAQGGGRHVAGGMRHEHQQREGEPQ